MHRPLSPVELMERQASTLYTCNGVGRIVHDNEPWPNQGRAPRLFVGWTPQGAIYRLRDDTNDGFATEAGRLISRVPVGEDITRGSHLVRLEAMLTTAYGRQTVYCGPAYRFPDRLVACATVTPIPPRSRLLAGGPPGWQEDVAYAQPCFGVVIDGVAVSVCGTVRRSAVAAEAGVDTLPQYRGRGYARRVVLAWAHQVRAAGIIPLYSTEWGNAASRRVAESLGLIQYGADLSFS